jgi:serine/threonine-protein kinase
MPADSGGGGAASPEPGRRVSHYEILGELGRGGMGVVYRARDLQLGREVALKRPCDELVQDRDARKRFMREARSASSLSHPNIVQLFEVFEEADVPWLVMEMVKGVSLRASLDLRGPVPVEDAIRHAEELAEALRAAHGRRILHRDITPKNVLLSEDGRARLTDFGLALPYVPPGEESSASTQSSPASEPGSVVGTPSYMSPEQALGRPLDPRSDIFSLGAVLYEMCSGRMAFPGAGRGDILDAVLHRAPEPISRHTYEVPEELERIIRKCLAKLPEERYQDAADLLSDLRALRRRRETAPGLEAPPEALRPRRRSRLPAYAAGLAAVAVLAAGASLAWRNRDRLWGGSGPPRNSDAWAYYERGLHYLFADKETRENLDDAIQMFHRSVGEDPNFALAWAALGEAYWIRFGQWTHDEASREEAEKAVQRALVLDTDLAEARNAKGRGLIELRDFAGARSELEKAVEARPELDRAWANLGWALRELEEYAAGLAALENAITLRPGEYRHQVRLGRFYEHFAEYQQAARAYKKATELEPQSFMAWTNLGSVHLQLGQLDNAVAALTRSISIEDDADARSNLGTAHFFKREYREAEDNYRRAAELKPDVAVHWANLGDALRAQGVLEDARSAYTRAMHLVRKEVAALPIDPGLRMRLGLYCARAGESACALSEGAKAAQMQPRNAEVAFRNAVVRSILGLEEEALDWLQKAVELGVSRTQIEHERDLQFVQGHPRYGKILALAG